MPGVPFPTSLADTYSLYQQSPQRESYLRESSVSTVTTNGPDSPAPQLTSFPYIATHDLPLSATHNWADESLPPQHQNQRTDSAWYLQQQGYWPGQVSPVSAPISALKNMAIAHHNSASSDDVPDFMSSRRSESTQGHNTPDTPGGPMAEEPEKAAKMPPNGTRHHPLRNSLNAYSRLASLDYQGGHVQLYRTESAACQDELFNPANFEPPPSTPQQPSTTNSSQPERKTNLSPKGNLVNERVRTANSIRSQSPAQTATREPSPFRQGAEFAPKPSTHSHSYSPPSGSVMPSAASIRQHQKDQADRKEFNRPSMKREVTKTISPKDALLDAPSESDGDKTLPAFTDTIPDGYQKHLGGSETYPTNFVSGTNQAFGQFVPISQPAATNMGGFRGLDLNNWLVSPMPAPQPQMQPTASQSSDKNPEFPAHLITMESSISDNVPASSQESLGTPGIRRPSQTSANTGTYACAHPGCMARFDGPSKLHKHRREAHPPTVAQRASPAMQRDSTTSTNATEEDEDSASPEPVGSAMASSALLARNSQTGPHKCTRINPQTGKPCNSIFSRPYDLTRHEDTIHDGKKQKVRCEYCYEERTFSRNDALTRHMRVVHPEIDFQGKRGRR